MGYSVVQLNAQKEKLEKDIKAAKLKEQGGNGGKGSGKGAKSMKDQAAADKALAKKKLEKKEAFESRKLAGWCCPNGAWAALQRQTSSTGNLTSTTFM